MSEGAVLAGTEGVGTEGAGTERVSPRPLMMTDFIWTGWIGQSSLVLTIEIFT
jgi:hypothetical protein